MRRVNVKTEFFVEFGEDKISMDKIALKVKDQWKANGKLVKDIKSIGLYLKPHERACYYVINQNIKGAVSV
jgi:hypothetical protein